jgi:hypothetical protein
MGSATVACPRKGRNDMGKRFAILIGAAALGTALMAVGASADFRSVHDSRGDTRCFHERGTPDCSNSSRRNADIVRATAGHEGGRLKHTIRVVGKFQGAEFMISTDSDRDCEWKADIKRGQERAGRRALRPCSGNGNAPTGRARYDFHRHSVEILFREGSIGNPQSYGWRVFTSAGVAGAPPVHAVDRVPNSGSYPRNRRYIRHRLGQTAAALASHTVNIDSRVTLPPQERRPFYGRVKSSKHACLVHRLVKVFEPRPGRDHIVDKDRTNQRGKWRAAQYVLPEGRYYAKVLRREEATAGTTFVCRGDRSPRRHVYRQG